MPRLPLFIRLASEREVVRECTKYHMMEAEVRSHPFQPQTNIRKGEMGDRLPIHKRTTQILADKQVRAKLQMQQMH